MKQGVLTLFGAPIISCHFDNCILSIFPYFVKISSLMHVDFDFMTNFCIYNAYIFIFYLLQ